jgi:hypothetical protein
VSAISPGVKPLPNAEQVRQSACPTELPAKQAAKGKPGLIATRGPAYGSVSVSEGGPSSFGSDSNKVKGCRGDVGINHRLYIGGKRVLHPTRVADGVLGVWLASSEGDVVFKPAGSDSTSPALVGPAVPSADRAVERSDVELAVDPDHAPSGLGSGRISKTAACARLPCYMSWLLTSRCASHRRATRKGQPSSVRSRAATKRSRQFASEHSRW